MTDFKKITKKQFDLVYNSHLPNGWTKVAFRYFSTNTVKEDLFVKKIMKGTLIGLFLIGFIGTILSLPNMLIGIPTLIFTGILFLLGIFMFGAFIMNNRRIKKMTKILGITKEQYNYLVKKFYG